MPQSHLVLRLYRLGTFCPLWTVQECGRCPESERHHTHWAVSVIGLTLTESQTQSQIRQSLSDLDKVFVSVYAITETNTNPAKIRISGRGSSHCFVSSRTLLCRRGWKCHFTLYTACSLAVMAAGVMFELNFHFKHSKAQSSFIHINWIILPMAAP